MAYRHRIRVRYGETDRMGVVHHSVYALYFEEARTAMMRDFGIPYSDLEKSGFLLPLTGMAMTFRRGPQYDEEFDVICHVASASRIRLRIDYRMVRAGTGELLAEGHTEHASVGPDLRPRRLPVAVAEVFVRAVAGKKHRPDVVEAASEAHP